MWERVSQPELSERAKQDDVLRAHGQYCICATQLSLSLLKGYAQWGLIEPQKRVDRLQT